MRILLITGSFPPTRCGVGDYTYQLALSLASDPSLKVGVLTSKTARLLGSHKEIALLPIVNAWDWKEISTIVDAIRQWAPDIIHIQYPTMGYGRKQLPWLLPLVLRLAGFSIAQTWHEVYSLKILIRSRLFFRFIIKGVVPGSLVIVRRDFQERTNWLLRWTFLNKAVRFIPNASSIPAIELSLEERKELRERYARPDAHMIAYFGFIYPRKRVELLFQIADANNSHLVIIGDVFREEELRDAPPSARTKITSYNELIRRLAKAEQWQGKVTMTGFLPDQEAARVIAAADAVIVPVLDGGGGWNSSVHAAQAQGTFVLTTSRQRHGYDPIENTYFAGEHDVEEMRQALNQYLGTRVQNPAAAARAWDSIGESHVELYRTQVSRKTRARLESSNDSPS